MHHLIHHQASDKLLYIIKTNKPNKSEETLYIESTYKRLFQQRMYKTRKAKRNAKKKARALQRQFNSIHTSWCICGNQCWI